MTLVIVLRASRQNKSAADYYAGGRSFTGPQNGTAIAGDYLSAASFLGICGAIAINGYDGFLYSIGFLVAWLVALLLVAELLRNTGKFTMADVLSFRLKQRPVRMAAALATLAVVFFYLLAQMAGAGGLVALLLGVDTTAGQSVVVAVVGALMILYVLVGGMKGTTWVQIIKAVLLIAGAAVMTVWVLAKFGFNLSDLLQGAIDKAGPGGEALIEPGKQYGATGTTKLDFLSLALALVLGTAGLPHVLMRFYTVPSAKEARRSVVWAIWLIGIFYLFTLVLGYGAGALVGPETISAAPGGVNSAAPCSRSRSAAILLGFISAVAFATILAVVAGLTITAAASFAHDIYANVIKRGEVKPDGEVKVARITVVVIGILAILGGIFAQGQNVAFLVALAFAVAASANLPTILYSLFWKRFNTAGALWSMYGGLISCVVLIAFSPVVSGKVDPVTGASLSMIRTRTSTSRSSPEQPRHRVDPAGVPPPGSSGRSSAGRSRTPRSSPRWRCARSPGQAPRRRRCTDQPDGNPSHAGRPRPRAGASARQSPRAVGRPRRTVPPCPPRPQLSPSRARRRSSSSPGPWPRGSPRSPTRSPGRSARGARARRPVPAVRGQRPGVDGAAPDRRCPGPARPAAGARGAGGRHVRGRGRHGRGQDILLGPDLARFTARVRTRPCFAVVLTPDATTLAARDAGRHKQAYGAWTPEEFAAAARATPAGCTSTRAGGRSRGPSGTSSTTSTRHGSREPPRRHRRAPTRPSREDGVHDVRGAATDHS